MQPARIVVFLPCHTLDDFPPWLEEHEADDVLAAWTAVWEPRLLAAVGRAPEWASVDLRPPDDEPILGVVPAALDQRFAAQADAICSAGSRWVRDVRGAAAVAAAVAQAAGSEPAAGAVPLADDFRALGMAVLLVEVLARRMRSTAGLETTEFAATVVAAARAAVAGHDDEARERLRECFGFLSATRSRYYSVDVWLVDLVLLADTTLGRPLVAELTAPTPLGIVATGQLVERLAAEHPASLARLRERCAAGTASACGGRDADELLALATPEQVLASFERGRAAWERHVGCVPRTFARVAGGGSAVLPAVLAGFGYAGAVWPLFDGTPLPDPHSSRIRWQGSDGACIEAVARPPLDARAAGTILQLAEKIGDAMDHDHTCVVPFAHYAGTASPWFADLRRIGAWTTLLGRFVTPATLFAETEHAGTLADFPADAFPPTLPGESTGGDLVAPRIAAAVAEAMALSAPVPPLQASAPAVAAAPVPSRRSPQAGWAKITRGLFGGASDDEARLVLESVALRLAVHPRTGGVLSLRAPGARGNRLSQALAVRSTRPAPAVGAAWESAEERAEYSQMVAERIEREGDAVIVSRGDLVAGSGTRLGGFTQRIALVDRLPLVRLEIDVHLDRPLAGPLFEAHVACRFAWNENDDIDLHRSLHGESIATERTRFTAPHFLELRPADPRGEEGRVLIATGGLPWHLRSTPHTVDAILAGTGSVRVSRRLVLGLGIEAPRPVALAILREPAGGAAP